MFKPILFQLEFKFGQLIIKYNDNYGNQSYRHFSNINFKFLQILRTFISVRLCFEVMHYKLGFFYRLGFTVYTFELSFSFYFVPWSFRTNCYNPNNISLASLIIQLKYPMKVLSHNINQTKVRRKCKMTTIKATQSFQNS